MREMLKNPSVKANYQCDDNGCNAFFIACYYGRGKCMLLLANSGIDIMCSHKYTGSNGLHAAVEQGNYSLAKQLVKSKYPLNEVKEGGLTALMIIVRDSGRAAIEAGHQMIIAGADLNHISKNGSCALAEAIIHNNKKMAMNLLKWEANIFHKDEEMIDYSAFFQAINHQVIWGVELMCDHGADI